MTDGDGRLKEGRGRMKLRYFLLACVVALGGLGWMLFLRAPTGAEVDVNGIAWPGTPAGRWAKDYIEAFNADEEGALRQFIEEHYSEQALKRTSLEEELSAHQRTKKISGKLGMHSVHPDGDYAVDVIARWRLGWANFRIDLEPNPPHDPISVVARPTLAPDD
ncbi:MAG: hypothetical protein ACYTFA_04160 [Planctomycetota bacterium]|jgi:hypothetical protein